MIKDQRRIMFDSAALMAAFEEQAAMLQRLGLSAPPITITIAPGKSALEICMFNEQKGCIDEVEFGGAALAALLMAHCQRRGVPLPRRSRKHLAFSPDHVSILFETEVEPAARRMA